jgi:hypothetical protein
MRLRDHPYFQISDWKKLAGSPRFVTDNSLKYYYY